MDIPLTIKDAAAALRAKQMTSTELTSALLARTKELNPTLGAFITIPEETALAEAAAADAKFEAGTDLGPLQGIPYGVKDIIATKDAPTTTQSLILDRERGAGHDAVVVQRLRAAGAVLTGKAATLEFAIAIADDQKPFPIHRTPWDTDHWPGGSSAGTPAKAHPGSLNERPGRKPGPFCFTRVHRRQAGRSPSSSPSRICWRARVTTSCCRAVIRSANARSTPARWNGAAARSAFRPATVITARVPRPSSGSGSRVR